ncbi:DNA repair protein RecN [Niallia sp. NCCP-28]|uniref:DNA repair protein RecN n=1 Tax=Niallia sp. NCCP-28 TaxID=2934712 RepID=UPI0020808CB7|nr:DNA repair protein RecN [Niallia sp. NCCP-28]GKU81130.1 DNA repair protein RecN [Niallia sp. NCCP-28]
MLSELSIKNFAIIDSLSISFQKGLTVLTGETGAGKSIIIDAINLLVGGRGSSEFVRHGEEKAEIEGLFYIDEGHPCFKKMQEFGVDIEEGTIILRRDIALSGKSVCRINGKLITISTLREIGSSLIDIHGQHEHQELMDETRHLNLLDTFAINEISKVIKEYEEVYEAYVQTKKKLSKLTENEQQMAQRLDLLQFQHEEITNANLRIQEDEELMEERKRLMNYERIFDSIQTSYNSLRGEQKGLDWLGEAMGHLEDAATLDTEYKTMAESVSNSYYILEDVASKLRNSLDFLEYDPERLNEIESRLNEINGLKRKYGKTVEEIVQYAAKIAEELETLQNKETHIDKLEKELMSLHSDLLVEANELTVLRKMAAERLTDDIHKELKELYMEKTIFEVKIKQNEERVTKIGIDEVEFYISTNPGEPLKPLSKIVSGGELSRMMLALKSIFSKHQGITSIIFDEVDTGVSGRVAQAIAEKIAHVSNDSQVLCISHLPQVAAMADTHLFIAKNIQDGRTSTTVNPLAKQDKIKEIARMISGTEITELTKKHAKELLKLAQKAKNR